MTCERSSELISSCASCGAATRETMMLPDSTLDWEASGRSETSMYHNTCRGKEIDDDQARRRRTHEISGSRIQKQAAKQRGRGFG
jgi:hypothetical protein